MISARPKLLAIRTLALGDICMLMPIVRALQDLFAIDWLVHDRHAAVIRSFPELKCRILESQSAPDAPTPFPEPLVRQLQEERYDYCLDFAHTPAVTELVARLQDIPVRAIAHDPQQDLLLDVNPRGVDLYQPFNKVVPVDPQLHQIEKWRALVEAACGLNLNLTWPTAPRPRPGKTLRVFLHVHASKKSKRWPVRYFASVLRSVARKRPLECFITESPPRYVKRLQWLLPFSRCRLNLLPFDSSLRVMKECMETVDFAFGCDTGPLHFAGLLGVPTVVVYGPYSAREFRPVGQTYPVSPPTDNPVVAKVARRDVQAAVEELIANLDAGRVTKTSLV